MRQLVCEAQVLVSKLLAIIDPPPQVHKILSWGLVFIIPFANLGLGIQIVSFNSKETWVFLRNREGSWPNKNNLIRKRENVSASDHWRKCKYPGKDFKL